MRCRRGRGIYVAGGRNSGGAGGSEDDEDADDGGDLPVAVERMGPLAAGVRAAAQRQQQRRLHHEMRPPWSADAVRSSRGSQPHLQPLSPEGESWPAEARNGGDAHRPEGDDALGAEDEEDALLQRALELSLLDGRAEAGVGGGIGGVASEPREAEGESNEDEDLARAIAESLRMQEQVQRRESSPEWLAHGTPAVQGAPHAGLEGDALPGQAAAQAHAAQEARAAQAGAAGVQHAMADAAVAFDYGDTEAAVEALALGEPALPVSVQASPPPKNTHSP